MSAERAESIERGTRHSFLLGLAWLSSVQGVLEQLEPSALHFADASFSGTVEHPSVTFRLNVPRGCADIYRALGAAVEQMLPELLAKARALNATALAQEHEHVRAALSNVFNELGAKDWQGKLEGLTSPEAGDTVAPEAPATVPPPPGEPTETDNPVPTPPESPKGKRSRRKDS